MTRGEAETAPATKRAKYAPTTAASLPELLAARAAATPGAPALAAPGRPALGYESLHAHVGAVAAALRTGGIGPGDRVAVLLPNGPELAAAFLAVASCAGCAPLNPAYREQELEFYLGDLAARALLVEAGTRSPAPEVARRLGVEVLELAVPDRAPAGCFELRAAAAGPPAAPGRAEDVALLLHTSGTTARPKLVPLTHAQLCSSASAVAEALALTEADRCLNVMPLFHVHGLVAALLGSLWAGGAAICAPGFDAARFFAWVEELEPTWYTAVPTMHQAVLARAGAGGATSGTARLRVVRSCSAPLPPRVAAKLEDALGCPVIEAYGMTEAAHQIASNPLPPLERKPGSVGRPTKAEVAILDEAGAELPAGTVGEVAIRGPGVFAGYVANPEANAAAFTNGWFRTGDEGSLDADGYLFLHGRLKEIVNRGGEKISPREIDEALLAHPAVAQAVAFARPHERLGEDVAAAVVLAGGAAVTQRELQEFVAARLADFKVPGTIVFLEELPKGPTGKLQRIGLAERLGLGPVSAAPAAGAVYVEPRTPLERELATLVAGVLGRKRVGATDDFFALGGDSLAGAALVAQIVERGLAAAELPQAVLLWAPTVERLAEALAAGGRPPAHGSLVPIQPEGTKPPFFFVHGHDGDALAYAAVARRMTSGHPFYGVEAHSLQVEEGRPLTIEGLGRAYADEVRAFQPAGPYFVGGRCLGGAVALELARSLVAAGEEVALLVLVGPRGEELHPLVYYSRRLVSLVRRRRLVRALLGFPARRARVVRQIATGSPVQRALRAAVARYEPRPYPGRIVLLRDDYYVTAPSFWARVALGGLDAYPVVPVEAERLPGAASNRLFAEQLDEALRRAEARVAAGDPS